MATKWTALSGAPTAPVTAKTPNSGIAPKASEGFQHWALAGWAFAAIAVAVVVAVSASPKRRTPAARVSGPKTVSEVLKATAVPTVTPIEAFVQPKAVVAEAARPVAEPTAEPAAEPAAAEDQDYLTAFQRALQVREKPMRDEGLKTADALLVQAQLEPLKEALFKSGKTVSQYLDETNLQVSDNLLEALEASWAQTNSRSSATIFTDPEAMMLARDALQFIDPRMPSDVGASMLRDMVAAQTEAARLGIELPSMSEEHIAALQQWASRKDRAGQLAATALSRLS